MAYNNLKAYISSLITTNGTGDITGAILDDVLAYIVDAIGAYGVFAGIAGPSTNPGTLDAKVFYFLVGDGTYTHFNGTIINDGKLRIASYDGSWTIIAFDVFTATKINELLTVINNTLSGLQSSVETNAINIENRIGGVYSFKYKKSVLTGDPQTDYLGFDAIDAVDWTKLYISKYPYNLSGSDRGSVYPLMNIKKGDFVRVLNTHGQSLIEFIVDTVTISTLYFEMTFLDVYTSSDERQDEELVEITVIPKSLLAFINEDMVAAIGAANSPSAINPFATINDVEPLTTDEKDAITGSDNPSSSNVFITKSALDSEIPFTDDQKDAIVNAYNSPSAINPFATSSEVLTKIVGMNRYFKRTIAYNNQTLPVGWKYAFDGSGGSFSVNLIANPVAGDAYDIFINSASMSNTITINGNGSTIDGNSSYTFDDVDNGKLFKLIYSDYEITWKLKDLG